MDGQLANRVAAIRTSHTHRVRRREVKRDKRFDRAAWRSQVLVRADRLEAELKALGDQLGDSTAQSVVDELKCARAAASHVEPWTRWYRALSDWWRGTSVETAWRRLHLAEEQLTLLLPLDKLAARYKSLIPSDANAQSATPPALTADDYREAVSANNARSDSQHERVRVARNMLYVGSVIVGGIVGGLWAAGIFQGRTVGLGALGGAASIVFAFRGAIPSGPYNSLAAQSIVKVPLGAATAAMAIVVLKLGTTNLSSAAVDAYAVIFGFAQQAFSQLIDSKASSLTGTTSSTSSTSA